MIIQSKSFNKFNYTVLDPEKNEDFFNAKFWIIFVFAITSKETKKIKFWSICSSVLLLKIGKI